MKRAGIELSADALCSVPSIVKGNQAIFWTLEKRCPSQVVPGCEAIFPVCRTNLLLLCAYPRAPAPSPPQSGAWSFSEKFCMKFSPLLTLFSGKPVEGSFVVTVSRLVTASLLKPSGKVLTATESLCWLCGFMALADITFMGGGNIFLATVDSSSTLPLQFYKVCVSMVSEKCRMDTKILSSLFMCCTTNRTAGPLPPPSLTSSSWPENCPGWWGLVSGEKVPAPRGAHSLGLWLHPPSTEQTVLLHLQPLLPLTVYCDLSGWALILMWVCE